MKMTSTAWIVIGLIVVIGGLIGWSKALQAPAAPVSGDAAEILATLPDDHARGALGGSVVLTEYLDFECPSCSAFFPIVADLEKEFGDRVTFVTRYFPLSGHKNGQTSALAAEAAGRQGKFWEMHDFLYARQDEWRGKQIPMPAVFEAYAAELGLDIETFKADVASADVAARVKRDYDGGVAAGVQGTPTFFLNGVKIENPRSLEAFRALLQAELDRTSAQQ